MNKIIIFCYLLIILKFEIFSLNSNNDYSSPPILMARSAVLYDYNSNTILYAISPDRKSSPASMTKLLTLLITLDYINENNISMNKPVFIQPPADAKSRPIDASVAGLEKGKSYPLIFLLKATAIISANDAAYALAMFVSKDIKKFVKKMNDYTKKIGILNSTFVDPDGWSPENKTTSRDMIKLATYYINNHPDALKQLHSIKFLKLPNGIIHHNTNMLLGEFEGVDGLKTGYTTEAGFNFIGTAKRNNHRLISIVMDIRTNSVKKGFQERMKEVKELLEYGFYNFHLVDIKELLLPPLQIMYGNPSFIKTNIEKPITITFKKDELPYIKYKVKIPLVDYKIPQLHDKVGNISITKNNKTIYQASIITKEKTNYLPWKKLWWKKLRYLFKKKLQLAKDVTLPYNKLSLITS